MYNVLVLVPPLKVHMLMLVSPPLSFLFFWCINICVVFLFTRPVLMSVMLLWQPFNYYSIFIDST